MPQINITVRAYVVTLMGKGRSRRDIEAETGVKPSQATRLVRKAKERGWKQDEIALDYHVADKSRPGRPRRAVEDGDVAGSDKSKKKKKKTTTTKKKESLTGIHTETFTENSTAT
ncbi:hypothetical protein J3F83DRAFT_712588 [Trichoderma novae-zelandiae]